MKIHQIPELRNPIETNSEDYYDFQQIRPMVFINNSQIRQLKWPNTNVYALYTPHLDFDIVLTIGPEPSFKWQTFTNELLDFFDDLEVDLVITLGALLADAPHTRPGKLQFHNLQKRMQKSANM